MIKLYPKKKEFITTKIKPDKISTHNSGTSRVAGNLISSTYQQQKRAIKKKSVLINS